MAFQVNHSNLIDSLKGQRRRTHRLGTTLAMLLPCKPSTYRRHAHFSLGSFHAGA